MTTDLTPVDPDALLLDLDGYEGPIDVLLTLARDQKVDLTKISILQLARQYLAFVDRAQELRLELAADYLVMAAWLAYLKSRLLLPSSGPDDDEPSGEDMAEALAFQLRRLEAMREASQALMDRPQLGRNVFARGMPEGLETDTRSVFEASLYDLLRAYGDIRQRQDSSVYSPATFTLMSAEEALERLANMFGSLPRRGQHGVWIALLSLVPEKKHDLLYRRSALAATFSAGLELAKQGRVEIRQDAPFKPIFMRETHGSDQAESFLDNPA